MELAINGGKPIRKNMLNYGKQTIDEEDKQYVLNVLNENKYLTTGPRVTEFENKVKKYCNVKYACAVNSGTAALHLAVHALNLKQTDEVIVTCLSFVASSNCILYCGAKPVFCDIDENTLNIDPNKIEALITENTKDLVENKFEQIKSELSEDWAIAKYQEKEYRTNIFSFETMHVFMDFEPYNKKFGQHT